MDVKDLLSSSPVFSTTEWDPLEEVVVGRLDGAVFPRWQESMRGCMPESSWRIFQEKGGEPFPEDLISAAMEELDGLAKVLDAEGIRVMRPEPTDHSVGYQTPSWQSTGLYNAMPRDHLIVFGDTIIEAPLSWKCRQHEGDGFKPILKDYARQGARWVAAPRPELVEETFIDGEQADSWGITEFEPLFDAADFCRFGRDVVAQQSHVTNLFGISWVQSLLGSDFQLHVLDVNDPHAMHIDATLSPLAPGKLLVNPERYIPNRLFDGWDVRPAPAPALPADWPMYFCSPWVSMNVLSLGPKKVVVESQEGPLMDMLEEWGFTCIPVDFRHVYTFGGSFHCVTVDIRRQGELASYLAA
jgi:glycine amidinotransferase